MSKDKAKKELTNEELSALQESVDNNVRDLLTKAALEINKLNVAYGDNLEDKRDSSLKSASIMAVCGFGNAQSFFAHGRMASLKESALKVYVGRGPLQEILSPIFDLRDISKGDSGLNLEALLRVGSRMFSKEIDSGQIIELDQDGKAVIKDAKVEQEKATEADKAP